MSEAMRYARSYKPLEPYVSRAHHVDVISVASDAELRPFLAAAFSYQPGWLRLLFTLRKGLARLMGLRHEDPPKKPRHSAQDIPMLPGQRFSLFTVVHAEENACWIGVIEDKHLDAHLAFVRRPGSQDGPRGPRMLVVTVVRFNHWTGRVYFALILPFHFLVVRSMARYGARHAQPRTP
jgi:hypothetical protein